MTAPGSGSRYFVSYSQRSEEDRRLADQLRAGLESAGHSVFIDRGMRIGTNWVEEIGTRIEWCDFLVVLLSATSVHSEMVLGEVRAAHRKRRQDGRPQILPIRVRYDDPLDYELDSYLARFQELRWGGLPTRLTSYQKSSLSEDLSSYDKRLSRLWFSRHPRSRSTSAAHSRARICERSSPRLAALSGSTTNST